MERRRKGKTEGWNDRGMEGRRDKKYGAIEGRRDGESEG